MTAMKKPAAAAMPAAGDTAPDFTLRADGGKEVCLRKVLKNQAVVLYFYPKDDTPGCTVEAKDFATLNQDFAKAGVAVYGISRDGVKSHDTFKAKYCLPFDLLSDEEGKTCEDYGVWVEKSMYGKKYMGIERTTFLIGKDGVITQVWNKVKVDGHAQDVLEAAQRLLR